MSDRMTETDKANIRAQAQLLQELREEDEINQWRWSKVVAELKDEHRARTKEFFETET